MCSLSVFCILVTNSISIFSSQIIFCMKYTVFCVNKNPVIVKVIHLRIVQQTSFNSSLVSVDRDGIVDNFLELVNWSLN